MMLANTTYGLNSSYTKKIHVGLQTSINDDEFDFQLAVKFTSKGAEGICFNMVEWQQFQENMELMTDYLNGNSVKSNSIIIKKIIINFTTTYGARALLLKYQEQEEPSSGSNLAAEEIIHTPKKPRTYSYAIAMQKTTFLGLENLLDCVNANLNQLNIIANSVNDCSKYLINEIQVNLPNKNFIESNIVKHTINTNCHNIQRNVRLQLKDLTFLDTYFEIIFLELIALYFNQIVRIIKLQRKL